MHWLSNQQILGKILTNPPKGEETFNECALCQEKSWDRCAEEATRMITTFCHHAGEARQFNFY